MDSKFADKKILIILFLLISLGLNGANRYRFSYKIQGKSQGKFLFIFPYRVYFEMGGAAVFKGSSSENSTVRFELEKIDSPGYLMRTLSLSGRKLGVFTCDTDPQMAKNFARQKMSEFDPEAPSFSRYVKKRFLFPYKILSANPGTIAFSLHPGGNTSLHAVNLKSEIVGNHGGNRYYFFVYRMMMEILKLYNHSYLPENDLRKHFNQLLAAGESSSEQLKSLSWKGPPLQLSKNLTRIGGLMAAIIERHVQMRQQGTFELLYGVKDLTSQIVVLEGSSFPNVKVYGGFKITSFRREVKINHQDGLILEDSLFVEIRNSKGRGGYGEAKLVKISHLD